MIEPVREFVHVFAKVPSTDFVVLAYDTPLENRPKALYGVRVDVPTDVCFLVIDRLMPYEVFEPAITREFVGHYRRVFDFHLFSDEPSKILGLQILCYPCPDISLTLDNPDHGDFLGSVPRLLPVGPWSLPLRGLPPTYVSSASTMPFRSSPYSIMALRIRIPMYQAVFLLTLMSRES